MLQVQRECHSRRVDGKRVRAWVARCHVYVGIRVPEISVFVCEQLQAASTGAAADLAVQVQLPLMLYA